jgi:TonB family protein
MGLSRKLAWCAAAFAALAALSPLPLSASPHKKPAPLPELVQPRGDPGHPHTVDRPLGSESEAGTVLLKFRVRKDGSVSDIALLQSSGFKDLDQAAAVSVSRWRYLPATRGGEPVDAPYEAKVDFTDAETQAAAPQAPLPPSLTEDILDMTPEQFVTRCGKDRAWCEAHVAASVHADAAYAGTCPPKDMDKSTMTGAILQSMNARHSDWDKIPALTMIGQSDSSLWPCR